MTPFAIARKWAKNRTYANQKRVMNAPHGRFVNRRSGVQVPRVARKKHYIACAAAQNPAQTTFCGGNEQIAVCNFFTTFPMYLRRVTVFPA